MKRDMVLHDDSDQPSIIPDDTDEEYGRFRQRSPLLRVIAALVVIGFLLLALPNISRLLDSNPRLSQDPALNRDPVASAARPAIVSIEAQTQDGLGITVKRGTGFNISEDGLIITNQHVVSGAAVVSVVFIDGKKYFSKDWVQVGDTDLAVVDVEAQNLPCLRLNHSAPQADQAVVVIGNPLNMERLIQKGAISDVSIPAKGKGLAYIEILVTAAPGLSGSPVIDGSGQVIAVVYAARKHDQSGQNTTALAIPLSAVQDDLHQALLQLR